MEKVSIVIPAYNEQDNVKKLHRKIKEVEKENNLNFEIIFVNDGSSDQTLARLKELSDLKIINLRKNFGQTAALDAGIKEAQGEIIVAMDADLQNDPRDIPRLLDKMDKGYDLVSGWRHNRKDSFLKNLTSRGANYLRGLLVKDGIHDSGCTLKAYRGECFDNIDLFGEMHRFIPGILKMKGYKVGEIKVKHHARKAGQTKYSYKRILKGFLDMIAIWFWRKFSNRPLHLFGGLGMLLMSFSFLGGLYLTYLKIWQKTSLSDHALTLIVVFGILVGLQLFISGLLADILIKNYYQERQEEPYSIKEVVEK